MGTYVRLHRWYIRFVRNLKIDFYTFREVDGVWRRVDSLESTPLTLADYLFEFNLVIDADCTFCRIERFNDRGNELTTYEYKAYRSCGQIKISVTKTKYY